MMGFNTFSYVNKFHKAEMLQKEILNQKAFKVFFVRMRSQNSFGRFLARHSRKLRHLGAEIVKQAFIYQNNLFIHFFAPSAASHPDSSGNKYAIKLLYSVYHIQSFVDDFFVK